MVHASGQGHDGAEEPKTSDSSLGKAQLVTEATLKNPEAVGQIQAALVKGGLELRKRAEMKGTRQAIAQKLLDQMTPEAQIKFIEDTQGFLHMLKEGVMGQFTMGLRPIWKAAAPSLLDEEKVTLSHFPEDELKAYIAVGAMKVEESVAVKVDGELKDRVYILKVAGMLGNLLGPEVGETISGIAHLAEGPAKLAEKILPQVRETVNAGGTVQNTLEVEHDAIAGGLKPQIELESDTALDWDSIKAPSGKSGDSGTHASL